MLCCEPLIFSVTISISTGGLRTKVAASALAIALCAAAPLPASQTLRPFRGAAHERALHEVAREVAALRAAPGSQSEREKDLRYRLPLSIALVHAGNLRSARHQWRSMLRRISARDAATIASALPLFFAERGFAIVCPHVDFAAGANAELRRALALARERDDLAARRSLAHYLAGVTAAAPGARCALLAAAALAERDGDRGTARDRWFATLAVPLAPIESSLGIARYAALEALVRTMP